MKDVSLGEGVLLLCDDISISFGGINAVTDFSCEIRNDEIFGLIGPNGAGKTTIFNIITQFYKPDKGHVYFRDTNGSTLDLTNFKTHDVIKKGLVRTFQNIELIKELSLIDNLLVGAHIHFEGSFIGMMLRSPKARREEKELRAKAMGVLEFLGIAERANHLAAGQPYGVLKKVEMGRAIMSDPRLIIIDEPAAGLNDMETEELAELVHSIRTQYNCAILLIEHDMKFVMGLCDRVCAISFGKMLAVGTPEEIQANSDVQEAYLGKEEDS